MGSRVDIIREALKTFGMEDAQYDMIRHNENITCKVMFEGQFYSLRIHQPIEGFSTKLITGYKNDTDLMRSEVDLLLHMMQNGFDHLQKPMRNVQGEYVSEVDGGIPAMLLTWVEGCAIPAEAGSKYAEEIGELACRIHLAVKGFAGERIEYDNQLCDRMTEEIREAVAIGHLPAGVGQRCMKELAVVRRTQNKYASEGRTTMIHADLSLGNILITDHGLIPIDFSLSGYGSLAQEAGMLMSNYQDEDSCKRLLKGFSKAGEEIDATDADIFLAYSILLFICTHHNRVYREAWFRNALGMWCERLFIHE